MIDRQHLDKNERHFHIPGSSPGLKMHVSYLPAIINFPRMAKVVLYVHGGTFPSTLSIAYRNDDGRSWRDVLADAGSHVWGLDFQGFGDSDPYPEMSQPADDSPALGQAQSASEQLETAVRFICSYHRINALSIIAHSWGTMATGLLAIRCPELVGRLVFFAPITWRPPIAETIIYPGWRLVSLAEQWKRFTDDVPKGETAVLSRHEFDKWGEKYLDTDAFSRSRSPASVKTPSGPWQDIALSWGGNLPYDPRRVRPPVIIIRGEWDTACTDADARWLFENLKESPNKKLVTIKRATHLLHLETCRYSLFHEADAFLSGHGESTI